MAWISKKLPVVLLLLGVAAASEGLYSDSDDVLRLDEKNFNSEVLSRPGVVAVHFYAPPSAACKHVAPIFTKAAAKLKGMATLAAVNCLESSNVKFCDLQGVRGYPSIKLYGPDLQNNPYTGKPYKEMNAYKGNHTTKALVQALLSRLTDRHVEQPQDQAQLEQFLSQADGQVTKAVLLSEKQEVTVLLKALSTQLHPHLAFAQVHAASVPGAATLLDLEPGAELPALVLVKAVDAGGGKERYAGAMQAATLFEHLTQYAPRLGLQVPGAAAAGDAKAGPGRGPAGGDKGRKAGAEGPSTVKHVGVPELAALDAEDGMALVALAVHVAGASEACAPLVAGLTAALGELHGALAAVVATLPVEDLHQVSRYRLGEREVRVELTNAGQAGCVSRVVLLPYGKDKEDVDDYQVWGEGRHLPVDGKSLVKWVTSLIPAGSIIEVTQPLLHSFVTISASEDDAVGTGPSGEDGEEFDGADSQMIPPKVILFTNKDEVPGVYKLLATKFMPRMGGVVFGWVRAHVPDNQDILNTIKPQKVPGLMVLVPLPQAALGAPPTSRRSKDQVPVNAQQYFGPTTYKAMSQWLDQRITMLEAMYGAQEQAAVPALASAQDLDAHCVGKGAGLCIIALLEGLATSGSNKPVAKAMSKAALKFKEQPLYFSTVDATKYTAFAADLGLSDVGLPTVVALSARHLRVAALPGELPLQATAGASAIAGFVEGMLGGKLRTHPLQALPRMEAGGKGGSSGARAAAADEQEDAQDAAVEEEFDLSEILNEKVEDPALMTKEERLKQLEEQEAREAAEKAAKKAAAFKKKSKKSKKSKKQQKQQSKEEL